MPERYDPERSVAELRQARAANKGYNDMSLIMDRAAERAAEELWPDPRERELAGLGVVTAAATLARFAEPGRDAPILNAVGFFGLALVESARAEVSGA